MQYTIVAYRPELNKTPSRHQIHSVDTKQAAITLVGSFMRDNVLATQKATSARAPEWQITLMIDGVLEADADSLGLMMVYRSVMQYATMLATEPEPLWKGTLHERFILPANV